MEIWTLPDIKYFLWKRHSLLKESPKFKFEEETIALRRRPNGLNAYRLQWEFWWGHFIFCEKWSIVRCADNMNTAWIQQGLLLSAVLYWGVEIQQVKSHTCHALGSPGKFYSTNSLSRLLYTVGIAMRLIKLIPPSFSFPGFSGQQMILWCLTKLS